MKLVSTKDFSAMESRAARAEAALEAAKQATADANARFDALFEKYAALRDKGFSVPDSIPAPSPEKASSFPTIVNNELEEFASDPELYQHNQRWAMVELSRGTAPERVADAIKYGVHAAVYNGVHSSVNG